MTKATINVFAQRTFMTNNVAIAYNIGDMVNDVEILEHLRNSDHNIIVWKLICDGGLNTNNKLARKFHKADHNSMRDWLKCIDGLWNDNGM